MCCKVADLGMIRLFIIFEIVPGHTCDCRLIFLFHSKLENNNLHCILLNKNINSEREIISRVVFKVSSFLFPRKEFLNLIPMIIV